MPSETAEATHFSRTFCAPLVVRVVAEREQRELSETLCSSRASQELGPAPRDFRVTVEIM